jgi:hypothetical protein
MFIRLQMFCAVRINLIHLTAKDHEVKQKAIQREISTIIAFLNNPTQRNQINF